MGVTRRGGCGRLAWATLVANVVLVVTGGAVRLTGSGLGCPTWPRCTDRSFTPHGALDVHAAIEFGNRTLTFVLVAIAVATFVAAWRQPVAATCACWRSCSPSASPRRRCIGGITVLTDLNPWVVSFHLLLLAGDHRAGGAVPAPARPSRRRLRGSRPGRRARLAGVRRRPGWCSTSAPSSPAPVRTPATSTPPATASTRSRSASCTPTSVFLFLGLTVGLFFAVRAPPAADAAAARCCSGVIVLQAAVGFVQYFTDLPIVLVGCTCSAPPWSPPRSPGC